MDALLFWTALLLTAAKLEKDCAPWPGRISGFYALGLLAFIFIPIYVLASLEAT